MFLGFVHGDFLSANCTILGTWRNTPESHARGRCAGLAPKVVSQSVPPNFGRCQGAFPHLCAGSGSGGRVGESESERKVPFLRDSRLGQFLDASCFDSGLGFSLEFSFCNSF